MDKWKYMKEQDLEIQVSFQLSWAALFVFFSAPMNFPFMV